MGCNMWGSSVLYHFPEFAHIHVHWVSNGMVSYGMVGMKAWVGWIQGKQEDVGLERVSMALSLEEKEWLNCTLMVKSQ